MTARVTARMRMRGHRSALAGLIMGTALLGGCGQTGPLYLPERGTVVTRPASEADKPATPAPAAPAAATPAPATPRR